MASPAQPRCSTSCRPGAARDGGRDLFELRDQRRSEYLRLESEHGLSRGHAPRLSVAALDDSLCGIAAARRSPLIIENMQARHLPQARILQIEGYASFAAFPLLAHGEVARRGGLRIDHARPFPLR